MFVLTIGTPHHGAESWIFGFMVRKKPKGIPFGVLIHTTWPMGHIVCGGNYSH